MAKTKALQDAEKKIDEALRSGATEFDLSCNYDAKGSEKLTELPEWLGQLDWPCERTIPFANDGSHGCSKGRTEVVQL